jgi:hypothetical protein
MGGEVNRREAARCGSAVRFGSCCQPYTISP